MAKSLPKVLFVKREKDGDLEYFSTAEELSGMVEIGERAVIGVYKLDALEAVEGIVHVHPRRKASK